MRCGILPYRIQPRASATCSTQSKYMTRIGCTVATDGLCAFVRIATSHGKGDFIMNKMSAVYKRLTAFLLAVFLVIPCFPNVMAVETGENNIPAGFHAPTLLSIIEANLEEKNTDEEFFHMIADAFLADPALFSEMIVGFSAEDLEYLAKGISYDLQHSGRSNLAVCPEDCDSQAATVIARLICSEVGNPANMELSAFVDLPDQTAFVENAWSLLDFGDIMAGAPAVSATTGSVPSRITVGVTFSFAVGSTTAQTYTVKLYRKSGANVTLAATSTVTVAAGSVRGFKNFLVMLNQTGVYTYYAEIHNSSGTLLTTTPESAAVTVTGKWKITVELTADRTQLGVIKLYNASGTMISQSVCLGRSANNYPMNQTNGHTPIGEYTGVLEHHYRDTEVYGEGKVIKLTGVSGYVMRECSFRYGIWIHGGRSYYYEGMEVGDPGFSLCPTYGCVRVTNEFQEELEIEITDLISNYHDATGTVMITQDGLTDLEV